MKSVFFLLFLLIGISGSAQCLLDKDAGSDSLDLVNLLTDYNKPSPYTFEEMLGINDAGQFQGIAANTNPIALLTTKMRSFHAMDYDFNPGLIYGTPYADLIKPEDTNGIPTEITSSQFNYSNFVNSQGMEISAATVVLNRDPLTWKEKIWQESDWWPNDPTMTIPQRIRESSRIYTEAFLQQFGLPGNHLVKNYQVGNELWDYPFEEDYHAMLQGAHDAFKNIYGTNSSTWPTQFMPGSFQAAEINNKCVTTLRDYSNCGSTGLWMFNQIGDYLNVSDCSILQDMHAINVHAYAFDDNTLTYVHPEKPNNEFLRFIPTVAFRDANPILQDKGIWLTETGYDSWDKDNGSGAAAGVGALTQSAYLLRSFMMTSRFHLERVDLYMGFDDSHKTSIYHGGVYSSSGLWKLGIHPTYGYPSGIPSHGARPKPSFFSLLEFKSMFGDKVFLKSLSENDDLYAYVLAKPDSSDAYLVIWNPTDTDDTNLFNLVSINETVNLPNGMTINTNDANWFATTGDSLNSPYTPTPGNSYTAVGSINNNSLSINQVTRMPAFIPLNSGAPPVATCDTIYSDCSSALLITGDSCSVSVSVTGSDIDYIKVSDLNYVEVDWLCRSWSPPSCTNGLENTVYLSPGSYIIQIIYLNGNICEEQVSVYGCQDADGDGVDNYTECVDETDKTDPCSYENTSVTLPVTADQSLCPCTDFTPTVIVVPTSLQGVSSVGVAVRITELGGVNSESSAKIVRIPSDGRLTFSWDPSLTSIGFTPVDNTQWIYLGDNGLFHSFSHAGVFSGGTTKSFGFVGSYDPQNTDGQTTISATVVPFSGGECNIQNNSDAEQVVYFD